MIVQPNILPFVTRLSLFTEEETVYVELRSEAEAEAEAEEGIVIVVLPYFSSTYLRALINDSTST